MTHPTPTPLAALNLPDTQTRYRMTAAFDVATRRLGARPCPDAEQVWGWRGRTLSGPVTLADRAAWMRLASGRIGEIGETFWHGNAAAERALPMTVPRPRLLLRDEWATHPWCYAAEMFEHATADRLSETAAVSGPLSAPLSPGWWTTLHAALEVVATVPSDRFTIGPIWADQLVIDHFGQPPAGDHPWATCHGDLHWANLTGGDLVLFDWEGWGSGPVGYDAATLLVHSLLVPDLAAQVRARFADVLDGEHGRYAQQVVVAEQVCRRGDTPNDPLLPALHEHAATLRRPQSLV